VPDPDPLVIGTDPRILIHTKMSWIVRLRFFSLPKRFQLPSVCVQAVHPAHDRVEGQRSGDPHLQV
jgi:hypothetical protein